MVQVSVIVATYHSDYKKILETVDSILIQQKIDYEIVMAEDSADNGYYSDLKHYFEKKKFAKYKFVYQKENQGTVKNILCAAQIAEGEYIKPISPGDLLINEYVLDEMYRCAVENNAAACFGDVQCYSIINGKKVYIHKNFPNDIRPYIQGNREKAIKNNLLLGDVIYGVSILYNRIIMIEYMSKIAGSVILCEDLIMVLLLIENKNIVYTRKKMVLYEYGLGISAPQNTVGKRKIKQDQIMFARFIQENYKKYRGMAHRREKMCRLKRRYWITLIVKEFFIIPEYTLYQICTKSFLRTLVRNGREK